MDLHRITIYILLFFIVSCVQKKSSNIRDRIEEVLQEESIGRELQILNLEVVDSTLVDLYIRNKDLARHYREKIRALETLIELKGKRQSRLNSMLESYDYTILNARETNHKDLIIQEINNYAITILEDENELVRTREKLSNVILSSNQLSNKSSDSIFLIHYYLRGKINDKILDDTVKIYLSRDLERYEMTDNVLFTGYH